ncbi:MAG: endonuclease/exonuclease/phosphatase family protein [Rhodothermales bacterium]
MSIRTTTAPFVVLLILVLSACGAETQRPPQPAQPSADTVRVLAYNIHHGEGMDGVTDLERIAALIREVQPDLVTLQEVDSVVERTGGVDQATVLGELTGMAPVFGEFMPYQGGKYGMALLSAWPIVATENIRLPDGDEPRTALSAVVASPETGRELRLVGIHFYRTEEERLAQAQELEAHLSEETRPTILAGDFNSEPGGTVMGWLAERWHIVPKGDDNLTFSSFNPVKEIDFILLRPRDAFEVIRHELLDEPVISDHRPVVIDFILR